MSDVTVLASSNRFVVTVGWNTDEVNGEFVQLVCTNPDGGDVSNTAISKNNGQGVITYPEGYSGHTVVTVHDNHGNTADATISVEGDSAEVVEPPPVDPDAHPEHPIVLPPDIDWDAKPEHPIVLPPDMGFNPPPSEFPPHPEPN